MCLDEKEVQFLKALMKEDNEVMRPLWKDGNVTSTVDDAALKKAGLLDPYAFLYIIRNIR